jgi:hypothetical protein
MEPELNYCDCRCMCMREHSLVDEMSSNMYDVGIANNHTGLITCIVLSSGGGRQNMMVSVQVELERKGSAQAALLRLCQPPTTLVIALEREDRYCVETRIMLSFATAWFGHGSARRR